MNYSAPAIVLALAFVLPGGAAPDHNSSESTTFRNTASTVHYVGSKTCAGCHPDVAARYAKTGMARSIVSGDNFTLAAQAKVPFTLFDRESGEYFDVSRRDGEIFQSQYALDRNNKELFRQTWKISYVIGSGEGGIGFLIERNGYLFEAPLSYYAQSAGWSFSPGYELHNYAFRRPVVAECLGCHSGRPRPIYGTAGLYRDPPFEELAVGCENCHGPGELHVSERRARAPLPRAFDTSIVNPARLSGWMSDNICMKCHQAGDVRIEQPGKHAEDFRPGTRLDTVVEVFKVPLQREAAGQHGVLLEHYYSMTMSKCYRLSSGALHCTSCHEPHTQLTEAAAVTYYRSRCLVCHTSLPCKLDASERQKTTPPDACTACHMPKRDVLTIAHAALTEHRIVTGPEEPLPDDAWRSADSVSGLVRVTAQPNDRSTAVPDIVLFQAYAKLIHEGYDEFRPRMDAILARLSRAPPDDARVLSALARREVESGTPNSYELAAKYLTRAVKTEHAAADDFLLLAQLDSRANKHVEAIQTLRTGMRANPYVPEITDAIAAEYVKLGDYSNSLEVIRRGLSLFPDDKILRALMNQVQSATIDNQ